MKFSKVAYVVNGVIKVNNFPVEPKDSENDKIYQALLLDAKVNAKECVDQVEALGLIAISCPTDKLIKRGSLTIGVEDGLYSLPSGWTFMVEKFCSNCDEENCTSIACVDLNEGRVIYKHLAKLYKVDECQFKSECNATTITYKKQFCACYCEEYEDDVWTEFLQMWMLRRPINELKELFTITRKS